MIVAGAVRRLTFRLLQPRAKKKRGIDEREEQEVEEEEESVGARQARQKEGDGGLMEVD